MQREHPPLFFWSQLVIHGPGARDRASKRGLTAESRAILRRLLPRLTETLRFHAL